ncbi:MAG: helix-turn-helix domain-containing protein [Anaerotignaceae bacterium]
MEVLNKIKRLMKEHDFSEYQLAKLSGVPQTTINSLFRKGNLPTIPTLENICSAFGISLAQFFADGAKISELTPEQVKMFEQWSDLTAEQKQILFQLIQQMK